MIGAIALAVQETLFWLDHVYEANAKIQSNCTVLSSSVNGNIDQVHVKRGDLVEEGALLASMKTDAAELEVALREADLERERAVRVQVQEELSFFRSELDDKIATAEASVGLLKEEFATLNERLAIARKNIARSNALQTRAVVPKQRVDDANDKMLEIQSKLRDTETDAKISEKRLQELQGQRKRDAVYRSRLAVIDRNIDRIAILVAQSMQRLKDMHVYSPMRGIVSEIHANPGAYVEDGVPVLLLHDPSDLWIEANVDESDIRHVKVGQPVRIEIDAYPFEEFKGRVEVIGRVTLASIANPTIRDNHDSATQKIPVTISMPPIDRAVWPGMRASVNIAIR